MLQCPWWTGVVWVLLESPFCNEDERSAWFPSSCEKESIEDWDWYGLWLIWLLQSLSIGISSTWNTWQLDWTTSLAKATLRLFWDVLGALAATSFLVLSSMTNAFLFFLASFVVDLWAQFFLFICDHQSRTWREEGGRFSGSTNTFLSRSEQNKVVGVISWPDSFSYAAERRSQGWGRPLTLWTACHPLTFLGLHSLRRGRSDESCGKMNSPLLRLVHWGNDEFTRSSLPLSQLISVLNFSALLW